ncbi:MAG TPA: LacI family DNA-binding transcriptional regulator [Sphingomonas sp.]|nr:LacI family DNA-binding transcriptional regulator [Sphingomonas sp.]
MKTVTIKDVAERAGVSPKTVSRVINDEVHVRPEVREQVMRVVAELDYRPNAFARGLSSAKSFLIGMFFDDPASVYAADLQRGALARCRALSHHLLIEQVDRSQPDWMARLDATLRTVKLAGAVLTPPICDWPDLIDMLEANEVPIVRIAPGGALDRTPQVRMDDRAAAREVTEKLIALGHRDIGFIKGNPTHSATVRRWEGFCDAIAAAGISIPPKRVLQGDFTFRSGLVAAEAILGDGERPTAIFASNDEMALAALVVAMRHQIAVPSALSIVGFDDAPVSRMAWPQLSTVRQPNPEMAAAAIDLLVGPGQQTRDGSACVELPYEFIERGSLAASPRN